MLSKTLKNDMTEFINKYNGGAKNNNNTKRIGRITEDDVRYFLYITVLTLNAALTIKHKDLMELNVSKILKGDCEPGFLNLIALSPLSPVYLPPSCKNYLVLKSAMSLVLSSKTIDIIYPLIIFFAGLIATRSYVKINAELLNTIVSTIFNRVKTDDEKDKKNQRQIERAARDDVAEILSQMQHGEGIGNNEEKLAAEILLTLKSNVNVGNESSSGSKSKKNKTKGGKSKKNKTRKSNTKKNKTRKN